MAEKAGKDTGVQTGTPYDDVFRTLLNNCRQLVIQLVNEVSGENYTGEEEVVFSPNEHFLNQQDGSEDKRITDTSFSIIGNDREGRGQSYSRIRKYQEGSEDCYGRKDSGI